MNLLGSVASALVEIVDTRIMPGEIATLLESVAAERGHSIVQGTYYAGALYVQKYLGHWRDVLRSAKTDEAP